MKQTFKKFLEAMVTDYEKPTGDLPFEELEKLLNGPYSRSWESYEAGFKLWRGFKDHPISGEYNPSTGERRSQNTSNHYTLFFDTNPKNAYWPKRSKSFICTTSEDYASVYGKVKVILPHNNTELAVCPSGDIWDSGLYVDGELIEYNTLNKYIREMEEYRGKTFTNFSEFEDYLHTLSAHEFNKLFKTPFITFTDDEEYQEFIYSWVNAYSYEESNNGFELVESVDSIYDDYREVWFSGKCLILDVDDLDNYKEWLENRNEEGDE